MDFVKINFHTFKNKIENKELFSPILALDPYGKHVLSKRGSVLWSFW
jgi:hypothetical protein